MLKSPFYILLICILLMLNTMQTHGQAKAIDSLKIVLKQCKEDSVKVTLLNKLSLEFSNISLYDTSLIYAKRAKQIAERINYKAGIAVSYNNLGNIFYDKGNYPQALQNHLASLKIKE